MSARVTRGTVTLVLCAVAWFAMPASLHAQAQTNVVATRPSEPPVSFAVVIGNNKSLGRRRPDLHYADDDAARYYAILQTLAPGRVALLSRFDRDTRLLFPAVHEAALSPTRAALESSGGRLAREVQAVRDEGREVELYFVFAGHGDVAQGQGFIELEDARFTAKDLEGFLRAIPFSRAHVILDSCNSFFMLGARKPGGRHFATSEDAARALSQRLPNVGVFLSTSAEGEAFEWSEIQSGIFSHVVRSGLLGGADANGDGQVSYLELAGFVDTATRDVKNPNMRPHVFARGPGAIDRAPILRLSAMTGVRRIELDDRSAQRIRVRDADGLPLLDAHHEPGIALRLVLPMRWTESAVLERAVGMGPHPQARRSFALPAGDEGQVTMASLVQLEPASAARGPAETFELLFSQPFGPTALRRFEGERTQSSATVFGVSQEDTVRMQLVLDEIARADRTDRLTTTIGTLGMGGLLTVAGYTALPDGGTREERRRPRAVSGTLFGLAVLFVGGGVESMLREGDGETAAREFRAVVAQGGDTSQAFAAADKRVQKLLEARRSDRRSGLIFGSGMLAASATALVLSEVFSDSERRRDNRRLLAAGGLWMGSMILGDALMADSPAETLTKIWRDDPSLNQYQTSLELGADGVMLSLSGRWGR